MTVEKSFFVCFLGFFVHREHQFKEVNSDCQDIYQGRVSTLEKTVASCQQQLPELELSLQVSVLILELDLLLAWFSTWTLMVTLGCEGDVRRVGRIESPTVSTLVLPRVRIIKVMVLCSHGCTAGVFRSGCANSWLQPSWQSYLWCVCLRN